MAEKKRRRKWSDDEKRRIIAQTRVAGISVSQVARRYDVNANLIFKWLRDPQYVSVTADAGFLPVEINRVSERDEPVIPCPDTDAQITISLVNGHRLEIRGVFDGTAVVQLLKGLAS